MLFVTFFFGDYIFYFPIWRVGGNSHYLYDRYLSNSSRYTNLSNLNYSSIPCTIPLNPYFVFSQISSHIIPTKMHYLSSPPVRSFITYGRAAFVNRGLSRSSPACRGGRGVCLLPGSRVLCGSRRGNQNPFSFG